MEFKRVKNVGYDDDEGSLTSIIRADELCLCNQFSIGCTRETKLKEKNKKKLASISAYYL
jgi:hypothetical protein